MRVYFWFCAVVAAIFGLMMLLFPVTAAGSFGMDSTPAVVMLLRALGGMILSTGFMNFMVRNEPMSGTLRAVLWTNVVTHALSMAVDVHGAASGVISVQNAIPGQAAHTLIIAGALYFLLRKG